MFSCANLYYKYAQSNSSRVLNFFISVNFHIGLHVKAALVLKYNLDLKKLEWTPLLLASTKSVNCQIDANCSPFQSLNMLPFHIRLERWKLTYYSLISNFSKYYFKTGTFYLLFLSSHVVPAIEFDSNYFGILLWK